VKHRRFRDMAYSLTEKTISKVPVSPGSAETFVRRGGITNHTPFDNVLCQQRLCHKSPKSVDECQLPIAHSVFKQTVLNAVPTSYNNTRSKSVVK